MACGIYKITCKNNDKIYIGSSKNIKSRWHRHRSNFRLNQGNPIMLNSYNKYGMESFIFEIIEECDENILIEREIYWADFYKKEGKILFNCGEFIDNPTRGTKLSDEFKLWLRDKSMGDKNPAFGKIWVHKDNDDKFIPKEKLSEYENNGYIKGLSDGHKKKISENQFGRKMSEKNKEILIKLAKRPKTDEAKKKMSETRTKLLGIKVYCLQTEEFFNSYTEAAIKNNTTYQSIRQSIQRGKIQKYR